MRILIFGKGGISGGIKEVLPEHQVIERRPDQCDVCRSTRIGFDLVRYEPDWIINCAGVDDEYFYENTICTNLIGTLNVAQAAGQIPSIHIASVAGLYGKPDHVAYSASKAGVISVVQSLGFTQPIWAISPGRVDTPMRERNYPNDTPGSRLEPVQIGHVVKSIMDGVWESGTNVVIRKVGLTSVVIEPEVNLWKERLRVGQPKNI